MLLNQVGVTQIVFGQLLNRVHSASSASKYNPLHVSSLGSSESEDAVVSEHFEANGVDSFLVYDDKALVIAFTDFILELDNLLAALISEATLAFGHFISIGSVGEEELRVNFCLFILKRNVAGENVTVLEALGHIRVPSSMVEHQPLYQLSITCQTMDHMHNLDHMKVNRFVCDSDDVDRIYDDIDQLVGEVGVQLCAQSCSSNTNQQGLFYCVSGYLEAFQELQGLLSSQLISFGNDTGVNLLLDEALCLLHEFPNEKNIGGSAVSDDIVLGSGRSCDHACSWVLDLHFVKEHAAVLGEFDLSCAAYQHLEGSLGSEVRLHNFLESHGCIDIHGQCLYFLEDFCLRVEVLHVRHNKSLWTTSLFKNIQIQTQPSQSYLLF